MFDVFYAKYFCPCGIPVMRAGEDIVIDGTQRYLLYDLPYIMEKKKEERCGMKRIMWNDNKVAREYTELH